MNSIPPNVVQLHSSRLKKWDTLLNADKAEQIRLGREGGEGLISLKSNGNCNAKSRFPRSRPTTAHASVSDPIRVFIRIRR